MTKPRITWAELSPEEQELVKRLRAGRVPFMVLWLFKRWQRRQQRKRES